MYLIFYLLKKFKIDKHPIIQKFFKYISSIVNSKNEIDRYKLKQYFLFTSTKLGRFIYISYTVRIARFLGFLGMLIMIYVPPIVSLWIEVYGYSPLLKKLASQYAFGFYIFIGVLEWIINVMYVIAIFCMSIYYVKDLIRTSPMNVTTCMLYAARTCAVAAVGMASGVFIPAVDNAFEKNGLVPLLKFLYAESATNFTNGIITPQMGSEPSKDLYVLHGDEFPGANLVQTLQNKTLEKEEKLHLDYIEQESKKKHF